MSMPMQPFESQNVRDDDGAVIDSLFVETDAPPDLKELQEPIVVKFLPEPAAQTRILSGDVSITPTMTPYQLLPPDPNRKSFNLYVYSPTAVATDGVRISDDPGMVLSAGKILHNGTIDLGSHTGPIYIAGTGLAANNALSANVSFQYWAVTS